MELTVGRGGGSEAKLLINGRVLLQISDEAADA